MTTMTDTGSEWRSRALCAQTGGDWWFVDNTPPHAEETKIAKTICGMCDVRTECLEWALRNDERFGIWGGLTPKQRNKLRRQRGIPPRPPRIDLEPCGTEAAVRRHQRRRESPCRKCTEIRQANQRWGRS